MLAVMNTHTSSTFNFTLPVRVYYEDTDAGGVVYHSNYINFMERSRTEWLRSLGFEQDTLIQEWRIAFVVRSLQVDYLKPARFNDLLYVEASVGELGRTSVQFKHHISRKTADGHEDLFTGSVHVVCIDIDRFRPTAIPTELREKLYCER